MTPAPIRSSPAAPSARWQRARCRVEASCEDTSKRNAPSGRPTSTSTRSGSGCATMSTRSSAICRSPISAAPKSDRCWCRSGPTKNPTAGRVRQYHGGRHQLGDPRGHSHRRDPIRARVKRLQFALPFGIHEVTSHPSLPFEQAPAFLAELRAQEGVKAKAMEFVMLTAARIADICGGGKAHSVPMLWSHVDLDAALWTIPDTKMGRPHIVPLSEAGAAIARRDAAVQGSGNPTSCSPAPMPAPCSTPPRCATC